MTCPKIVNRQNIIDISELVENTGVQISYTVVARRSQGNVDHKGKHSSSIPSGLPGAEHLLLGPSGLMIRNSWLFHGLDIQ